MVNNQNLLFQVEKEIATLLLDKLEGFQITFERASQIAKFTLAHLPENLTDEQVMQIVPSLDDQYYELAGIVHKHMSEYEEKYKTQITDQVRDLITHKHFEEASNLMSGYFNRKFTQQ